MFIGKNGDPFPIANSQVQVFLRKLLGVEVTLFGLWADTPLPCQGNWVLANVRLARKELAMTQQNVTEILVSVVAKNHPLSNQFLDFRFGHFSP